MDEQEEEGQRQAVKDQFLEVLRSDQPWLQLEFLAFLVREYGGDGDLLREEVTIHGEEYPVFAICFQTLTAEAMASFLRLLLSDDPLLLSKMGDGDGDGSMFYDCTLLHMAVWYRAPVEVVRLLIEGNREAVTMGTAYLSYLPIHMAFLPVGDLPPDLATVRLLVEADPDTLKVKNGDDMLPLHHACDWFHLVSTPEVLASIELVIDAHPDALKASDNYGTPIMTAIERADRQRAGLSPEGLQLLQRMIHLGGSESLWVKQLVDGEIVENTALVKACWHCLNKELLSWLIKASPDALAARCSRGESGRLPLHAACYRLTERNPKDLEAIQFLIDADSSALEARDLSGATPIMVAISSSSVRPVQPSPEALQLLKEMIHRAPESVRATVLEESRNVTVLEKACIIVPDRELVAILIETWRAALCVSLPGGSTGISNEIASMVTSEAHDVLLAMIELALHESTLGVVPDSARDHVRQVVGQFVPREALNRSSLAVARAIKNQIPEQDYQQLRFAVLSNEALQEFLLKDEAFQDLLDGIYRMNKEGRLNESNPVGGDSGSVVSVEMHIRTLAAAGNDLSCHFIHLRGFPVTMGRLVLQAGTVEDDDNAAE
jgi:hypothetical protein